jgi:tetratricopeptide (TPR) repeat protein
MDQQHIPELQEGDIFYTEYDGRYHVYKLLRRDEVEETFHVLCYAPINEEPTLSTLHQLEIHIYHAPIHPESFNDATFLMHAEVSEDELIGFYEYQKQMDEEFEQIAHTATEYYQKAYQLTDDGQYEEAIEAYSKAIELLPTFYEALDNRAFCKMDLGRWRDAIDDFTLSLQIHPDSLLAEFSIGECYYRLGNFISAKEQFEKCLKLDPNHQVSKDLLLKTIDIINSPH